MSTTENEKKVSDMTVGEFRSLMKDILKEVEGQKKQEVVNPAQKKFTTGH